MCLLNFSIMEHISAVIGGGIVTRWVCSFLIFDICLVCSLEMKCHMLQIFGPLIIIINSRDLVVVGCLLNWLAEANTTRIWFQSRLHKYLLW